MAFTITVPKIHSNNSSIYVSLIKTSTNFQQPNKLLMMMIRKNCISVQIDKNRGIMSGRGLKNKMTSVSATAADHHHHQKPTMKKQQVDVISSTNISFAEELRFVAIKLHTNDASKHKGGKQIPRLGERLMKEKPSLEGYVRFLVDSKVVYDTLEKILLKAACPLHAELRNTGLERSDKLAKDLEWFKETGHAIPEPSAPGLSYAQYLEDLAVNDPKAFLCHFYNVYFGHAVGGRMFGKKVAEKILDNKELEFYKWDGDLSQLLQNAKDKLNRVAENWSREEKDHCLEETEISFEYSETIMQHILS